MFNKSFFEVYLFEAAVVVVVLLLLSSFLDNFVCHEKLLLDRLNKSCFVRTMLPGRPAATLNTTTSTTTTTAATTITTTS